MKRKILVLAVGIAPLFTHAQVTIENGAGVYIQENADITVQGDLDADDDVGGAGFVVFNGAAKQAINAKGNALPSVYVANSNGVLLSSPLKIHKRLSLQSGHLALGGNNLELGAGAQVSGGKTAYILTGNGGKVFKAVNENLDGFVLPIGTASGYSPLALRSSGTYSGAILEIAASAETNPNKPSSSRDYLNSYWTISRRGISGELEATASYSEVSGNEENIQPYFWDGHKWIAKEKPVDTRNNLLSIDVPEGSGEIYAMRKGDELTAAAWSMDLLPNPVHSMATLTIRCLQDENAVLRILNNAGATVMTQRVILRKGANQVRMNVTPLAAGNYIISSTHKNSRPIKMVKR